MQLTLSELKIPLAGAACALVAGLLMGAAMQPHLYDGDRPSGPQMFADWAGGARSTGPFDAGTTFVNYPGKMPDYVMGTDWKRATAWPDEHASAAVSEPVRDDDPPAPRPSTLTRTAYEEPPAPLPGYPSLGGARSAGEHAADDDTVDADPAG